MTNSGCADCHRALAVEARAEIIRFLRENGPSAVNEIVAVLDLRQPTVSHHLKVLEEAGMVSARKEGRNTIYTLCQTCPQGQLYEEHV